MGCAVSNILATPTSPTTLADFTSPRLLIPNLSGTDAAAVIQELSQAMRREGRVPDLLPFYHAALNREFLVSTETEAGMAFPHARIAALQEVSFALGRSREPLAWSTRGMGSVRLVFLIAVPANDSTRYLSLISGLARLAKEPQAVEKLYCATDPLQMFEVLQQTKLRTSSTAEPIG